MDVARVGKAVAQPKKKPRRRGPRLTGVSKQRRVANARERRRVEILNMNIQILRHMIPLPPQDREPSKTEVIWLAVDYITELTKMLETADRLQAELERVDVDSLDSSSLDSLDSLEGSPLFNFEGEVFLRIKATTIDKEFKCQWFTSRVGRKWRGVKLLSKNVFCLLQLLCNLDLNPSMRLGK